MNEFLRRILFLPVQASTIASSVDALHYAVILTTMAGAILVTLVGGYFLIRYRRTSLTLTGPHPRADARPYFLYKLGALIGLAVLFLVWWVVGLGQFVRMRVAPPGSMIVYVTAKQWMWKFAYPEGARSIATLYVPAGRPVQLVMTSRDVTHSFFVPDFRVKQDVVPGRFTTLWFEVREPGTYPILCTQYCGTGHSMMRGEVVALRPDDYARWVGRQEPPPKRHPIAGPRYQEPALGLAGAGTPAELVSMVREGERVAAEEGCLRCHSTDGTPHLGPTWAGLWYARIPLDGGGEVVADEAYLTESMMDPKAKIHRGFQAIMPSYQGRLRPAETAALLELMRSLRDVRPEPWERVPLPVPVEGKGR